MDNCIKQYYSQCFNKNVFSQKENISNFDSEKQKILNKLFIDGKYIYKFYFFDSNDRLNKLKLSSLKNEEIWCSQYFEFLDTSEFDIKFNISAFNSNINTNIDVEEFVKIIKKISNLASFTYEYSNYMWGNYGGNGMGFCVKYEVLDSNFFYPILYDKKEDYDFTEDLIYSFNSMQKALITQDINELNNKYFERLAVLPFVLKDSNKFCKEKEIRLLDKNDIILIDNNFNGRAVSLKTAGLKVNKIIIDFDSCPYRKEITEIVKDNNYKLDYRY